VNKRQTSAGYSNIRIHPILSSSAQSQLQAPNSPLVNSIKTLSQILMVHPVQGNLVIPPMCTEYTSGRNEGKCEAPLPTQNQYSCGPFGTIPLTYIGTREVCETSSQAECIQAGPNGTGIPNADYLLFVSTSSSELFISM